MNSESVKALVRNLSKSSGIEPRMLLTSFMIGCFLERVSASKYRDHFILKGGMLIAAMVGVDLRSTMDLDATITRMPATKETIEQAVREIIGVPIDDGVAFRLLRVRSIREEFEYECYRFHFEALMERTVVPFHIDISTGDVITPKEIRYRFHLLLEPREIEVLAYNLETILAEKILSILHLGTAGTRMRDYYDVYMLRAQQAPNIDRETLRRAIERTATQRHHEGDVADWSSLLDAVQSDATMHERWEAYRTHQPYARAIPFPDACDAVRALLSETQRASNGEG